MPTSEGDKACSGGGRVCCQMWSGMWMRCCTRCMSSIWLHIDGEIDEQFSESADDVSGANKNGAELLKDALSFLLGLR
jgi:hypothetical protein